MSDYQPTEIRGFYRSPSHLPIWEVIDKGGIWEKLNIKMSGMVYCGSPPVAEGALFDGKIDFISGNHITPYALITKGKPIGAAGVRPCYFDNLRDFKRSRVFSDPRRIAGAMR